MTGKRSVFTKSFTDTDLVITPSVSITFFFSRDTSETHHTSEERKNQTQHASTTQPCVVVVTFHLVGRWHLAVGTLTTSQLQQGSRKSSCSHTRNDGEPLQTPSLFHPPLNTGGSARSNNWTNTLASLDLLPPTSNPRTINLARPPGWTSSGYVCSLRRRARLRARPSLSAAPLVGLRRLARQTPV